MVLCPSNAINGKRTSWPTLTLFFKRWRFCPWDMFTHMGYISNEEFHAQQSLAPLQLENNRDNDHEWSWMFIFGYHDWNLHSCYIPTTMSNLQYSLKPLWRPKEPKVKTIASWVPLIFLTLENCHDLTFRNLFCWQSEFQVVGFAGFKSQLHWQQPTSVVQYSHSTIHTSVADISLPMFEASCLQLHGHPIQAPRRVRGFLYSWSWRSHSRTNYASATHTGADNTTREPRFSNWGAPRRVPHHHHHHHHLLLLLHLHHVHLHHVHWILLTFYIVNTKYNKIVIIEKGRMFRFSIMLCFKMNCRCVCWPQVECEESHGWFHFYYHRATKWGSRTVSPAENAWHCEWWIPAKKKEGPTCCQLYDSDSFKNIIKICKGGIESYWYVLDRLNAVQNICPSNIQCPGHCQDHCWRYHHRRRVRAIQLVGSVCAKPGPTTAFTRRQCFGCQQFMFMIVYVIKSANLWLEIQK